MDLLPILDQVILLLTNKIITHRKTVTQEITITIKTNTMVLEITLSTPMVDLPTAAVILVAALEEVSPNKTPIDDSRALVRTLITQHRHSAVGEGISTTCNGRHRALGAVAVNIAPDLIPEIGRRLPIDHILTMIQNLHLQVNTRTTLDP